VKYEHRTQLKRNICQYFCCCTQISADSRSFVHMLSHRTLFTVSWNVLLHTLVLTLLS